MPAMRRMRLPAKPSRTALITGMPPATAASNANGTPRSSAVARAVAGRHRGDGDRSARPRGDHIGIVPQQLKDAASDRAQASDGHREGMAHDPETILPLPLREGVGGGGLNARAASRRPPLP